MPRQSMHPCPGNCGHHVPHHYAACAACWRRLPVDYRQAILSTYRRDHADHWDALADACAWFAANPHRREVLI